MSRISIRINGRGSDLRVLNDVISLIAEKRPSVEQVSPLLWIDITTGIKKISKRSKNAIR
jgi:hypothetical protein